MDEEKVIEQTPPDGKEMLKIRRTNQSELNTHQMPNVCATRVCLCTFAYIAPNA